MCAGQFREMLRLVRQASPTRTRNMLKAAWIGLQSNKQPTVFEEARMQRIGPHQSGHRLIGLAERGRGRGFFPFAMIAMMDIYFQPFPARLKLRQMLEMAHGRSTRICRRDTIFRM